MFWSGISKQIQTIWHEKDVLMVFSADDSGAHENNKKRMNKITLSLDKYLEALSLITYLTSRTGGWSDQIRSDDRAKNFSIGVHGPEDLVKVAGKR